MFRQHSIEHLHSLIKQKLLNPIDIYEHFSKTITKFNKQYHAYVTYDLELLKKSYTDQLNHDKLRPLEYIPIGIKDVFNTIEFPTEMGSTLWKGYRSGNDARAVYNIKNAGGLIAGKTVTAEFAVHALNETINPYDRSRTPGTSSSGSAVSVALGITPAAIGTQTGSSIIRPASFCGVYGFKPSFGLIPRTGSLKTTDSLDTVGFFVSHPKNLRRVFDAMRVHGPNYPFSHKALSDTNRQNKKGKLWKVGFVKTHTWNFAEKYARDQIINFVNNLSNNKNYLIEEIELPDIFSNAHNIHSVIYNKSLSYYFQNESLSLDEISEIMKEMLSDGANISSSEYRKKIHEQNTLINACEKIFEKYDVILSLSTGSTAPLRNEIEVQDSGLIWTLTHLPSLSVPIFQHDGLPFGLQICARKYNDYLLCNFTDDLIAEIGAPLSPIMKF